MASQSPNANIKCSVSTCNYHCRDKNYCSLNEIKVGCSDPSVTDCSGTECASFELGGHGGPNWR